MVNIVQVSRKGGKSHGNEPKSHGVRAKSHGTESKSHGKRAMSHGRKPHLTDGAYPFMIYIHTLAFLAQFLRVIKSVFAAEVIRVIQMLENPEMKGEFIKD